MSKKAKQNDDRLLEVADELNKLLFANADDEGFIDVELETEELKDAIVQAAELLDKGEGDELTEETITVLQELYADVEVTDKKVLKRLIAFDIIQDGEPEKDEPKEAEEVDDEENGDNLATQIEDAKKMSELKDIAKSNDEFKKFRGSLSKYNTTEKLREAMLDVLEKDEPEPDRKEKISEKKVPEKKEKKLPSKKEETTRPNISRTDAVMKAIHKLCKTGATMETLMVKSDEIYVQAGGKSNPTATNVHRYCLHALVEFGVLILNDNGKYKFSK